MQTQISKLGRSHPQSKGLHYFKSAEVCTCKHFQKSARSNDIKSLFFLHIKGLHFMRLYKSPFTRRPCESSSIPLTKKSPCAYSNRKSPIAPRTSKVCLRSRAFEVFHKQNYRTFHHEKRGSDGNGNRQSDLDNKQQTPHTSFVYYSNIRSASGTYHVRTSSAVGVCPPGKWNERL